MGLKLVAALGLSLAASGAQSAILASDPIYAGNGASMYCFLTNVGTKSISVTSLALYITNSSGVFVSQTPVNCGAMAPQATCFNQALAGAAGENYRHYCIATAASTTDLRGSFQTIDVNENVLITESLH
jgi:hypothetical protein